MKFSIQAIYNWYRGLLRNPKYRWWVILGTMLYFISPFDIAPDFLPIVGEIDDVFLLTLLVTEVSGLVIEGFKARSNSSNGSNINDESVNADASNPSSPENANPSSTTVDVDAVPIK
jgi:uncharacterized membrane protein YkvA (DUF1232 family)